MAKPSWAYGGEGKRPASHLSARLRLQEAIAEAQSSLEQFSGIRSRPPRWQRPLTAVSRLALSVEAWIQDSVQIARLFRPGHPRHPSGRTEVRVDASRRFSRVSRRLITHVGLLLLLAFSLFWGGLQGALAQVVSDADETAVVRQFQPLQENGNVFDLYDILPAMPVVVRHPRVEAEPQWYIAEPARTTPPRRTEVITYTVQKGDTLTSIAAQFGLRIETLYWYNNLKNADLLSVGQQLQIPEVDGLIHEVKEGETLESIAESYGVRKGNMIAYAANQLREPYTLQVGQKIFVPGASKPIPRPAVSRGTRPSYVRLSAPPYAVLPGGERFSWPVVGRITDRFGWTGRRWHTGLDIAVPWGTPIYAAAAGTVISAGWHGDLGYMVAIDHGEGWVTRYGHMAGEPVVSVGQWVERGQLIGYVGCTGWCTGPHVHFEVLYNGAYTDPLSYLQ